MLRLLVLLLAMANVVFFTWRQGHLDRLVGVHALGDREPERMARQVRQEVITVMPSDSATALMSLPEPGFACLEAGPYTPAQIGPAEGVLQTILPPGSWVSVKSELPGVWVVYLGKYPNREALQKKGDELKRLKLSFEELRSPPELADGFALGRYDNRSAAERALAEFTQRGVRSARVAELAPPVVASW